MTFSKLIRRAALPLTAAAVTLATATAMAAYPERPVKIIVGFPPGGTTDFTARMIAQGLTDQMGKTFLVDNKTGASGTIAYDFVAKSVPDGYTLGMADTTTAIVPGLFKQLPFDVLRDFQPISQIISTPMVILVHPDLKTNTLKEFIAYAKSRPGKLNYGSGGTGSNTHLAAELFKSAAGLDIVHVPFRGAGDAVSALLAGQVQMHVAALPTAAAGGLSSKMRALAVTSPGKQRAHLLPDVPTTEEAGLPGLVVLNFFGLMAPAGTPRTLTSQLHQEIAKALTTPTLRERFLSQGADPVGSSPEEFTKLFREEVERWGSLVRKIGIQPE